MGWYPKLRGTSEQLFSLLFGTNRVQLKNNAGVLEARDDADAAFVIGRGATPVAANDWVTKAYADALVGSGAVKIEIRIPIGTAAATSSATSIPIGAIVTDAQFKVTTPYSVGATISLGQAGAVTEFMTTGDINPQGAANDLFDVVQDTVAASTNPLLVTIGGAPGAGAGVAIITYVVTPEA